MRFVDYERIDAEAFVESSQRAIQEIGQQDSLGRHVQQFVFAGQQSREPAGDLRVLQTRVDEICGDAVVAQLSHLILHERDQRRHNKGDARHEHGGQLKA